MIALVWDAVLRKGEKKSKLVLANWGKTVVFCAMLDFNLDLYIQAGSHANIMFHSRTEVEMICGVSFVGLESPVWHASYVFMLLPPHVNKSFNDDIVWLVCRPPTGWEIQGIQDVHTCVNAP